MSGGETCQAERTGKESLGQWKRQIWGSGLTKNSWTGCLAFVIAGLYVLVMQIGTGQGNMWVRVIPEGDKEKEKLNVCHDRERGMGDA